jgi:eukaryotic-like serine/threonine-protein kinase
MADLREQSFISLCLSRGLITQDIADRIHQQAAQEGRRCSDLVVEWGIIARHTVEALWSELNKIKDGPQQIGGYRILRQLGRGGMATVYLAEQISLGRQVALKLMSPRMSGETEAVERFLREAKVAAAITHPNVISIIDVGQYKCQPFMVLELVSGGDASQLATRVGGSLPEARALELIHDSALGLEALYAARLLHRDIKPSNIFIDANGRGKLADLGLARSESGDEKLTTTGITVGTPAYMSPEQARADENLDIRSDIYSLGATLYALVTGQAPYTGNSPLAIAAKVLTEPPPNPLTFQPKLSPDIVQIIQRTLAKDPAQRFQTPTELLEALTEAQEQLLNPGNRTVATSLLPRKSFAQGVAPACSSASSWQ